MKNLLYLFFFISIFSFSQENIPVIDFTKGDYPIGEKVRMNFDKDWRPTINIDSALYYRLITFKEKNIPSGKIEDYYITGELQSTQYSFYYGIDSTGKDSIAQQNGPCTFYYKNGNKFQEYTLFDNLAQGEGFQYHESGELFVKVNYVDDLIHGEEIYYYKSGEVAMRANRVKGVEQGEVIYYYETGEVSERVHYIDGWPQGEWIGYYESGEVEYIMNYVDGLPQDEAIRYYESGKVERIANYIDNSLQGEEIGYYESGGVKYILNYVDDLVQGEQIGYYASGEVKFTQNWVDNLKHGEQIGYYESGEVQYTVNFVDGLMQGEQIAYYKSEEVKYTKNYIDDLQQGEQVFYLKNGEVDYTKLWVDDKIKERRIALVIGNADYDKGKLSNPVNDANLIAESLEKLDFEVFLHTNLATEDEMKDAIADFGRKRKDYEIGFVYYAGHGIQLNNENYLLPVKEEFNDQYDVEDNAVSMQKVLRYLESTREGQLNFIVLDACRDNPFEQNWNKTRSPKGGGLAKTPPPTGSLIAFSTDHGQTAADGDGDNSLYSQALASKLLEEDVSIEQVFKNVRTEVLKLSNNEQSPVEESKLTGDMFYLNKKTEE